MTDTESTVRAPFAPWDRRELPGSFDVEETARRVGNYKWTEMKLFEALGGWVATVPELDVKMRLGTHCYHHAWHAELWHKRIREEWGFVDEDGPSLLGLFRQQYRGGRYSWGYPACPDLADNATVADLLGADRLGIECTEETGWQYQPEQTTSALICHHPRAKYFVAR